MADDPLKTLARDVEDRMIEAFDPDVRVTGYRSADRTRVIAARLKNGHEVRRNLDTAPVRPETPLVIADSLIASLRSSAASFEHSRS